MISGALGLWGVYGSNTKAATFYMWTWFPRYLVRVLTEFASDMTMDPTMLFFWGWRLFWFLYFLKVRENNDVYVCLPPALPLLPPISGPTNAPELISS